LENKPETNKGKNRRHRYETESDSARTQHISGTGQRRERRDRTPMYVGRREQAAGGVRVRDAEGAKGAKGGRGLDIFAGH